MTAPAAPSADGQRRQVTVSLPTWLADLRDPGIQAAVLLLTTTVAAFVLLLFAWRGAARTLYVFFQIPWVVSCGIGAFALILTSLGALTIHLQRRADAAHRFAMDNIIREALTLSEDIVSGRRSI